MKNNRSEGTRGEHLALDHLQALGMEVIQKNYRFGRGEIDLVAMDGEVLVFCEVKSRSNNRFGEPEYAVTRRKQQQIRRVAQGYLFQHQITDQACRFDVILIQHTATGPEIRYVRNAF